MAVHRRQINAEGGEFLDVEYIRIAFGGTLFWVNATFAADRYVATSGSDVANDCSVMGSPCLTVQNAVNQSVAGDTVHVAAGMYSVAGLTTVNKTLTFLGAQAGVDARTRAGTESVLSNTQGISIAASNVVFDGFTVQDSSVAAFTGYGIRIAEFIDGTPPPPNTNIEIHLNNIVGFATAGLEVVNAPAGSLGYATCNWWGSDTGPTNPTLNPSGTGDVAEGDLVKANFDPWLLGVAPDSACGAAPQLTKNFDPDHICPRQSSVLTITLINPTDTPANLTDPFVDIFPTGLKVRGGNTGTSCGGTLTAINGSSTVTQTGGTIPANGSCTITVGVTASQIGILTNTISAGALQTDRGDSDVGINASLEVIDCDDANDDDDGSFPVAISVPVPVPVVAPPLPLPVAALPPGEVVVPTSPSARPLLSDDVPANGTTMIAEARAMAETKTKDDPVKKEEPKKAFGCSSVGANGDVLLWLCMLPLLVFALCRRQRRSVSR